MKSLPGWITKIDEISNGILKVTLTDAFGHVVEVIDNAADETINKAYSDAFEIEKQVSKNWSKFLYDVCVSQLAGAKITNKEYNDKAFGSWLVEIENSRIVYMGKDFWLVGQTKKDNDWFDRVIINKDELTFQIFMAIINSTR